jgi:hypothetical protein
MKYATLMLSLATLMASLVPAAATEKKWEADCRRGWVQGTFTHDTGDTRPGPGTSFGPNDEVFLWDDKTVSVRLSLEDLLELQKHIRLLKQCAAFHQCLNDRADGKVKHCYENDKRWRALFRDE